MTKRECAIIEAYTGVTMLVGRDRKIFLEYAEELLRMPVDEYVHRNNVIASILREASRSDFIRLCREAVSDE